MSNISICLLGIGTVFVGLVCLIFLTYLVSFICKPRKKDADAAEPQNTLTANDFIENRQELVAAVSAVLAEEMGADISALRILSIKKI